jgi:hypothetical protein
MVTQFDEPQAKKSAHCSNRPNSGAQGREREGTAHPPQKREKRNGNGQPCKQADDRIDKDLPIAYATCPRGFGIHETSLASGYDPINPSQISNCTGARYPALVQFDLGLGAAL